MNVNFLSSNQPAHPDAVVCVIDVISAFTTCAYLFNFGADEIYIANAIEDARRFKLSNPNACLIGEASGVKIDGFDYGNCVVEFLNEKFHRRQVAMKTSSGTRGIINNRHSRLVLAASFVNADATANYLSTYLASNDIFELSFVITNDFKSSEDFALASYLCDSIFDNGNRSLPEQYLDIVKHSKYGRTLSTGPVGQLEMQYLLNANQFNFAMLAAKKEDWSVLTAELPY